MTVASSKLIKVLLHVFYFGGSLCTQSKKRLPSLVWSHLHLFQLSVLSRVLTPTQIDWEGVWKTFDKETVDMKTKIKEAIHIRRQRPTLHGQRWRLWTSREFWSFVVTRLIHVTTLSVYRWWRLCNTVESYRTKIWDWLILWKLSLLW